MRNIEDIVAYALAFGIVFFFSVSMYYNVIYIKLIGKTDKSWVYLIISSVSLIWIIVFSYIFISGVLGIDLIDNTSFGAIIIRPVILLTAVGTAISAKIRYIAAKGIDIWKSHK